jgi:hypothetical protein
LSTTVAPNTSASITPPPTQIPSPTTTAPSGLSPGAIGGLAAGIVVGAIFVGILVYYCIRRNRQPLLREIEYTPPPSPKPPEPELSRNVSINSFDADQIATINAALGQTGKDRVHTITRRYPEEMTELGGRLGTIQEYAVKE